MGGLAVVHRFDSWSNLLTFYRRRAWKGWVFRGHQDTSWELRSKLERVAVDRWGHDYQSLRDIEERLIRRFKSQAHQYLSHLPNRHDQLSWVALMQHHGTPTRLLDFTDSFYVGAYFALETAIAGAQAAIWAVDSSWCLAALEDELGHRPSDHDLVTRLWPNQPGPGVVAVRPGTMSPRLAAQQGLFLAATETSRPFNDNLAALPIPAGRRQHLLKLELNCSRRFIRDAVVDLHRMNVTSTALFPGLDGFAGHLGALISDLDALGPP